jgi:hypothetical protein
LPDLGLAQPLAGIVADYQRCIDEHERVAAAGRSVGPGEGLLHTASPASVQDLAACIDHRQASLIRRELSTTFTPGKIHAEIASSYHLRVLPHYPFPSPSSDAHKARISPQLVRVE